MAVADTDVNIFEDTENYGNGGGGGGGTTDVTIYSSRNTITTEEVSPGEWDVNVASESSLRYLIHNFDEFMAASVDVAKKVLNGDSTNCVFQIVNDIDMTSPTAEQASLYRVNGSSLIDITNKRYNFGKYFYRTTIMCDGTARTIQLTYPNGTNLDTWTFGAEWIRMNNVVFGGGVASYARFPNHGAPHVDTANFSRYLVRSNGNLNYVFENCEITCCGASSDSFNPFIFEGNGSNNSGTPSLYHTRLRLENCYFFHGADMGGSVYNLTVAPIVIHSEQGGGMERSFKIKQLTKSVGQLESELGLPNIQIRSYNPGTTSFNNIKTTWEARPWQTTGDGTALISCEVSPECLIFQTKVAVNDVFIQGQPTLQPEGATNTYNWVSLVSLLQNQGRQVIDSQSLEYFIGQITGNNDFVRVDGNIVFSRFFENSNNFIFFDAHGHIDVEKTLYLIPIQGYVQMCGLLYGTNYGESATCQTIYAECGGVGNSILKNSVKGARAQGLRSADIEVIEYNGENYLALVKNWSGGDLFLKGYSSLTQDEIDEDLIILYYDGTRQKWYSDSDLTQEVSFTVLDTSGRFPASLDFGGNTSQVVAGDGTFLNWGDKLGYWIGETSNLPPVGSRDANKLYITTDY